MCAGRSTTRDTDMDTTVGGQTPVMLARITPNMYQPRMNFDPAPMMELAQSIRSGGLVQPIVIQPGDNYHAEGTFDYTIVAGERRWRACCALAVAQHRNPGNDDTLSNFIEQVCNNAFGFIDLHRDLLTVTPIAATITTPTTGSALLIRATIENLHRADLNPVELGKAYQRLSDSGMSDAEIANAVGLGDKARSTVANARRMTKLPPDMQDAVAKGVISASVALAYLPAMDIKPHLIGEAKLDNQPNFPPSNLPTPAALRKRLCEPEKYGGTLSRDMVRVLVERIVDRCTPVPCADCGRNIKTCDNRTIDGLVICINCYIKRKEAETHTRWCLGCGHEQILNGIEAENIYKGVSCEVCGKSSPGYYWKSSAPEKPLDTPITGPQIAQPTATVYCPEGHTKPIEPPPWEAKIVCKFCGGSVLSGDYDWYCLDCGKIQDRPSVDVAQIVDAPCEAKRLESDDTQKTILPTDIYYCPECNTKKSIPILRYWTQSVIKCDQCGHSAPYTTWNKQMVQGQHETSVNIYRSPEPIIETIELTCDYQQLEYMAKENSLNSMENGVAKRIFKLPNGMTAISTGSVSQYLKYQLVYLCECTGIEGWKWETHHEYLKNIRDKNHLGFVVRDKDKNVWVLTGRKILMTANDNPSPEPEPETYTITADDIKERFAELLSLCGPDRLAELDAALDDIEAELFPETTAELQHYATETGL